MISTYDLKDGRKLVVREATASDATEILNYTRRVAGESDNLTFGAGEFEITYEQEVVFLEKLAVSDNSMMLLGICEGEVVSVINLTGMTRPRVHHFAELGVTVRKSHWNLGVGRIMMEHTEKVAHSESVIRRIHLKVRADNRKAVALYKSLGYEMEGTVKRQFRFVDDNGLEFFVDAYAMGKNID